MMRILWRAGFIAVGVAIAFNAFASEIPSGYALTNQSVDYADAITFDCSSDSPSRVQCDFEQTMVRYKLKASDLEADLDRQAQELLEGWEQEKDECGADWEGMVAQVSDQNDTLPPEKRVDLVEIKEYVSNLRLLCEQPTLVNAKRLIRPGLEKMAKTCSVFTHTWTETFNKRGEDLWVSQMDSAGICNKTNTNTLEKEDGEFLWEYTTRATFLGSDDAMCDGLIDYVHLYKYETEPVEQPCRYISFGL